MLSVCDTSASRACAPSSSWTDSGPVGWRSRIAAGSWELGAGSQAWLAGCRRWQASELNIEFGLRK